MLMARGILGGRGCGAWHVLSVFRSHVSNKLVSPLFSQITHPAGCMSQFIKFFGEQILVLWKFALLRKRILIFSPPPVGVVCYRGEQEQGRGRLRGPLVPRVLASVRVQRGSCVSGG